MEPENTMASEEAAPAQDTREMPSREDTVAAVEVVTTVAAVESADAPNLEAAVAASNEALKLLGSLDVSVWRYISYKDELAVLVQKPRELEAGLTSVGRYSVTVEPCWFMDRDCYKVRAEMKYDMPDYNSSLTLTSWLTSALRTLQESKVLVFKNKQQLIERKVDIVAQGDIVGHLNSSAKYSVSYSSALTTSHAYVAGQFVPEVRSSEVNVPPGFLSEGASLMFDRILVRRLANNTFSTELLAKLSFVVFNQTTDGADDIIKPPQSGPPVPDFMALLAPPKPPGKKFVSLATAIYSGLPVRQMSVGESTESGVTKQLELIGFERLTQPVQPDVLPVISFSYHMLDGHLAIRLQAGCPVQMQISYAPLEVPEDEFLNAPAIPRQELDWEGDVQLKAVFAERADELKSEFMSFIRHKPELRALLADFLQALLLRKPDNVIAFAAQYFSAFGSTRPLSSEVAAG